MHRPPTRRLSKGLIALMLLYAVASLTHFVHNAEYFALYPNMPSWIGRDEVYIGWLLVTSVGMAAFAFAAAGRVLAAMLLLIAYGLFGLDGLGHYALAPRSQHTLATNFTIWFEVLTGATAAACAALELCRRVRLARRGWSATRA